MRPRLLLVEDNPSLVKLVRALLTSRGYEVAATGEPAEVLNLVEQTSPELILMDVNLPGTDGLTLTRHLKASIPKPPFVIAFTASAMKGDEEKALEAGCDGYLAKPFKMAELLATIQSYVPILPYG